MIDERFWSKVDKRGPDDCWEWTAWGKKGYGYYTISGVDVRAHRFLYAEIHGPIPPGMEVCHTCDNPPCVNPAHLWMGTHADNMRDKQQKGRCVPCAGELNGEAKLSEVDVVTIRNLYAGGEHGLMALGERFSVSGQQIRRIVRGDNWSCVDGPISRNCAIPRGQRHHWARLTDEQVREVRRRYARGGISQDALAAEFGVSQMGISHIVRYNSRADA